MDTLPLPVTPTSHTFKPADFSQGTPFGLGNDGEDDKVTKIRALIGQAMNSEMLLCKFDNFIEHYGPSQDLIRIDDVELCTKALLEAGLLKQTDKGLQWRAYDKPPSSMEANENDVFAPLKDIVDAIFKYAGGRRGNDYEYQLIPYVNLPSEIAGSNNKMDACIVEKCSTTTKQADNGVVSEEFKKYKNAKNQIEVRQQILGDCQHIMSDDPRRMFIYGITIEDNRFSVWYFSRSHSAKAISFDWLSNDENGIDKLIRVYLGFALASPEDLGIDPHVRKARRMDGPQQYIYMYPKTAEELASLASAETTNDTSQSVAENASEPAQPVSANIPPIRHSSRLAAKAAAAEAERLEEQKAEDERRAAAALEAAKFRYFKTVSSIGPTRPYCISGRITRIWRVVEIQSADDEAPLTGKVLILKDVWLDKLRSTEAENLDKIYADVEGLLARAKEQYPGDDWLTRFVSEDKRFASFDQPAKDRLQGLLADERYKTLFLTKIVAWKGKVSKAVSKHAKYSPKGIDVFAEPDIRDTRPATRTTTQMGSESLARPRTNPPTRTTPKLEVNPRVGRRYAPKQQSRFVYEEVCTELKNLGTLGNFMDVIDHALTALQVLFCAGWVHRDISIGNVLAFEEEGKFKVKLSDLEFAERLGHTEHRSDPRTGTPYFMPIEIMSRKYLLAAYHRPPHPDLSLAKDLGLHVGTPEHNRYKEFRRFDTTIKYVPDNATEDIPKKGAVPRYNYQHDLESLWWLILYFITRGIAHYPSRAYAKNIFVKSLICSHERFNTISEPVGPLWEENLHPKLVIGFLNFMDSLRFELHAGYLALEVFGLLGQDDAYSSIHGSFARSIRELLGKNEGEWKDLPLIDPSSFESMKTESPVAGSKHALHDSDPPSPSTRISTGNKRIKLEETN